MLDLNHIFLFIAIVSPLAVLARAWRPGGTYRGWRIASFIVLAITGASWLLFRDIAGFVGGGAWFALLFLPAVGLRRVADLAVQHQFAAARKLATALLLVHPSSELRRQVQLLRRFESGEATPGFMPTESGPAPNRRPRLRRAPAVLMFISLNIITFAIECLDGGWDDRTLYKLGALAPGSVIFLGEYWRLISAIFLHAGPVHLIFNLFALYVLGVPLERSIGSIRFCACYLIAGIGSTSGVLLLARLGLTSAGLLVGASGAVMGIVGAWAAFLLLHRDLPAAQQRLSNVALIIAIQIAFDLSTPQVSMSAHLCGLITGFVVGLAIAPRQMSILA